MKRAKRFLAVLAGLGLSVACGDGGCGCEPPTSADGGVTLNDAGQQVGGGLQVTNANVRACDALFSVSGDEVPKVIFDSSVTGESIPKAPRFAISFAAASDASLTGKELATFSFATESGASAALVKATCYDGAGNVVDDALSLTD